MDYRKNVDVFDLVKFLMAIVVLGIHTLGRYGIYPIFRIAVPVFFMISSYLFFSDSQKRESVYYLKRFCIRNIKLYFFWFIILMPVFLPFQGYLSGNLVFNIFKLLIKMFLGSTFASSWYIAALIIGMCIVFFCFKKNVDYRVMLLVTFCIYAICCFNSNYRNLFRNDSIIVLCNQLYPGTIYNSFLVGLFWITLGYVFAYKNEKSLKRKRWLGVIISFIGLIIEYFVIKNYKLSIDNDCYFMLVPLCYFLFSILIHSKWKSKKLDTRILRKFSTVIYCVHGSLAEIIGCFFITGNDFTASFLKFLIVLILCLLCAYMIFILEKKKVFKWLIYAY